MASCQDGHDNQANRFYIPDKYFADVVDEKLDFSARLCVHVRVVILYSVLL
jgi:hypothetical protein